MSQIRIRREHELGRNDARSLAEELARELSERHELEWHWQEDVLVFHRPGVNGEISVSENLVDVEVRLGILLVPFKSSIEGELLRQLDARLG